MKEYISLEELYEAYYCCRKNKRSKSSAQRFELDYEKNLCALYHELNNQTYEIGTSTAFCVTRPKLREVFAADFRDRIVHHLIMNKFMYDFEKYMIEDSYNCRSGKGTLYGVERIYKMAEHISNHWTEEVYVLKCDLKGFFMSIDRDLLWSVVSDIIDREYFNKDKDWWKWLIEKVVKNSPDKNCVMVGDKSLFNILPDNKTLFRSNGRGLPIGNLTSQIFANLYVVKFDAWMKDRLGISHDECYTLKCGYGRYVDDFIVLSKDKDLLLRILSEARCYLKDNLKLTLHPDKVYIQSIYKGVSFVGTVIKPGRTYIGNRTVNNMFSLIRRYNERRIDSKLFVYRINSYFGFLIYHKSYGIRWHAWKSIKDYTDIYMKGRMHHVRLKKIYDDNTRIDTDTKKTS